MKNKTPILDALRAFATSLAEVDAAPVYVGLDARSFGLFARELADRLPGGGPTPEQIVAIEGPRGPFWVLLEPNAPTVAAMTPLLRGT